MYTLPTMHFCNSSFFIAPLSAYISAHQPVSSTLYIKYALDLAEFLNERRQLFLASDLKADGNGGFFLLVGTAVDTFAYQSYAL